MPTTKPFPTSDQKMDRAFSALGVLYVVTWGVAPGWHGPGLWPSGTGLFPPAEQRRIMAKVEQLMSLVDKLEAQLAASRNTAEPLMKAIVAELTHTA